MSLADTLRGPRATAAMFAALAAFWGTSFVAIQAGLHDFPPLLFAALRYALAGGAVLAYAVCTTERWLPRTRGEWLSVAVGGVFVIAVYHGLLYLGERHVPGAVAAVVVSTAPVLTAVFASLLLADESIGVVELVGFALGILGVVAIAAPGGGALAGVGLLPVALVFLSAVAFALGGVLTRPLRSSLPLRSMQAWTMLIGAGLLFGGAGLRGESMAAIDWTPSAFLSLAYLAVISGVLAFLIYFELLDRAGPSTVHLVSYFEPVVATVMSVALLGEGVGSTTAVGFLAVLAGFVVVERDRVRDVAARLRVRLHPDERERAAYPSESRATSETSD
ncbi:permease of the drug/metabolite transporter (DMT) superfamily [Halarchaeum acidiphilum MH1-52-1]|uniref:Permease of the drug/metabolite transporter (DMT) superfamily n=1 Tax=Halarchaeum acidiphilum MH1-52-1 TaxID=1261545 RepID=U3A9X4_9EURY|nr:DMT family transporter [Halarchaeum acidiphilum]GAD51563.1 permease of the drug/metabolite transporter (DMT) superfamily [Halarchaeum acidiphilum MH1-52-1]